MPEARRPVKPIEINYICDECENGLMQQSGAMDPESGLIPHKCVICSSEQSFKWP